jgi:hypothetical protein
MVWGCHMWAASSRHWWLGWYVVGMDGLVLLRWADWYRVVSSGLGLGIGRVASAGPVLGGLVCDCVGIFAYRLLPRFQPSIHTRPSIQGTYIICSPVFKRPEFRKLYDSTANG